ncbi:hypothetical protein [Nannocystis punicea]|uniref:Uncharacterized protein n=1 Tax=Nannocystis punicea TaxID=2995304 RepID=A0ABY7HDK3_9BACT|nr:hypothetical protein [Nannocystis poenicansa]WAS97203.1 hypothetical protein O0S08_13730 [Nannocystis poenicansa]
MSRGPGRPRKYAATPERIAERYAEAQRLEVERDRLAVEAERLGTIAAKVAMLAAEQQVAAAWASALRADGKIPAALKYGELAVKLSAAHAKALDQLIADRVDELHRRALRRDEAVTALENEPREHVRQDTTS